MADLPVVVGNELTLTPQTSGEVTGDQTSLVDLELLTTTTQELLLTQWANVHGRTHSRLLELTPVQVDPGH